MSYDLVDLITSRWLGSIAAICLGSVLIIEFSWRSVRDSSFSLEELGWDVLT
jgi:hypothetical protein